jgi:hyperosmotically inducible protein
MNIRLAASLLIAGAFLLPLAGHAADADAAAAKSSTKTLVKDSVITTKIKTELAAAKLSSLVHISVDTDSKGEVTLSGTADSSAAVDKAVSIAHGVKGVTSVQNDIKVVPAK